MTVRSLDMNRASARGRALQALLAFLLVASLALAGAGAGVPARASDDVGFRGPWYSTSATAPTGENPQSKLWHNDGSWWGTLYNPATRRFSIHRYDWDANTWSDTGVVIDERRLASQDALWDGTHLYIASALRLNASAGITDRSMRILRYSFDPATDTYTLDSGFPVTFAHGDVIAVVIDKDSIGRLWLTYTDVGSNGFGRVLVAHTNGDDAAWTQPFVIPGVQGATNLEPNEDLSALVSYNGHIGVMWSNQIDSAMYFAYHRDGDPDSVWRQNPAIQGPEYADNHINLKSLQADSTGQVYAATKTSLNSSSAPLILLLVLDRQGGWKRHTFARVADQHTRPLVLIDRENRQVYLFASSPCCSGAPIYYKQSSLDNISFPDGVGTPMIRLASDPKTNNVSSTKQELNSSTGLLIIASDDSTRHYAYNRISLSSADPVAPETTITDGPEGTVTSDSATFTFSASENGTTFACSLDGAAPTACASPVSYSGLADGEHTFTVAATDAAGNVDLTPASRTWLVETAGATLVFVPEADATLRSENPKQNTGRQKSLTSDTSPLTQSVLRFSVSSRSGQVAQATLRVWATNGTSNGPKLYLTETNWDERRVNWNNQPALVGAPVADSGRFLSRTWVEFDVTAIVNGSGTYSFALVADAGDGVVVSSRESSIPPQLVVVTVP